MDTFEESFGHTIADDDIRYVPMKLFLESDIVYIHPTEYMPMNTFFSAFVVFCRKNGYTSYRIKYGPLWRRYSIRCAKKKLVWENQLVKQKYLLGISTT
jgi:hypothetical protein